MTEVRVFAPQEGPQEAFLASSADIAIYGGAAGSGKSFAVLLWLASLVHLARYAAVVFRRQSTRLAGGGSIWEESFTVFAGLRGRAVQSPRMTWRFPSGAMVEFAHLQHAKDVHGHQSKQYATIVFEELCEFLEEQFWYMVSRLRTKAKVRAHIRATCNPDPDSFVRKLIAWWIGPDGRFIPERSGVLRWLVREEKTGALHWYDSRALAEDAHPELRLHYVVSGRKIRGFATKAEAEKAADKGQEVFRREALSLTFIGARLEDNPQGDPTYRSKLEALPFVQRERLLGGNWNVRASKGTVFKRDNFRLIDRLDDLPGLSTGGVRILGWARGWDKAATEGGGDWSVGHRVGLLSNGGYVILPPRRLQGTPAQVFDAMRQFAESDGAGVLVAVPQDPGQAGVVDVHATLRELPGRAVRGYPIRLNKVAYANVWSTRVERGLVWVVRGPDTEILLEQAHAFPEGKYDDDIDSISLAVMALGDVQEEKASGTGEGSMGDGW